MDATRTGVAAEGPPPQVPLAYRAQAWIAALGSRLAHKEFVFTAHNLAPPPHALGRVAVGYAIRRASAVICISQAVA